ncbi:hypothetical protein FFWV33_18540 [Flavobacterium faecale]|uniref:RagB/SusD family nutrient uptake outer membrane protein n=1 Tax=Flavobacterium faecale TaxID=1355330 RepID=A0A2S1LHX1_9FLAO|nr:RagB/SusD family nutrient uptake outer membrane protein [Flavobacterium faecale]AWG23385.1 hypothetical protein FFWV33_18540 [Flavobacterium faecale]
MKSRYKKIKRYTGAFLVALSVIGAFNSCEQFDLNENPGESQFIVAPYSTINEMELAVTGMYGKFRDAAQMSTFYVSGWGGDDITTHPLSNKADFREFDQRSLTPYNTRTLDTWRNVYGLIRSANTVLENTAASTLPTTSQARKDVLLGETYFLRAIMFHHLVRIHGKIVIKLDTKLSENPVLSPTVDVYKQIEKDLLLAESLLPTKTTVGSARPNKGSVRAILARLYLDWAGFPVKDATKNTNAASSAKAVIDNQASFGFGMVTDLNSLWSEAGRNNTESVFTVEFCQPCGLQNAKYGMLGIPGDIFGWGETFAEVRFYEDFDKGANYTNFNSYRKNATYYETLPLDANGKPTAAAVGAPVKTWSWRESKDVQTPVFKKVVGLLAENAGVNFYTSRNDYWMRMSEVYLIYAEASGAAGGVVPPDAWEALNKVRRRANNLPINTAAPLIDVVSGNLVDIAFIERKWEFAGEYVRWNDLVRREKVAEALGGTARDPQVTIGTKYNADGSKTPQALTKPVNAILGSLTNTNYFAPIPQSEVDLYPSLKQ